MRNKFCVVRQTHTRLTNRIIACALPRRLQQVILVRECVVCVKCYARTTRSRRDPVVVNKYCAYTTRYINKLQCAYGADFSYYYYIHIRGPTRATCNRRRCRVVVVVVCDARARTHARILLIVIIHLTHIHTRRILLANRDRTYIFFLFICFRQCVVGVRACVCACVNESRSVRRLPALGSTPSV